MLPHMVFVKDVTIGKGEAVPPNTRFVKTWRIQNPSDDSWPPGCRLRLTSGNRLGPTKRVLVEDLKGHGSTDVSVEMISPEAPGIYQGQWRMSTATRKFFGEVMWVIITVPEDGLLGLTEQMDEFHHLGSPPRISHLPQNPFAPPNCKFGAPSLTLATSAHVEDNSEMQHTPSDTSYSHCHSSPSSPAKQLQQDCERQFLLSPDIPQGLQNSEPTSEEMIH